MPEHQMAPPQSYPSGITTLGAEQLRAGQVGLWETLLVPLQKGEFWGTLLVSYRRESSGGPCWFPYKRVLGDPAVFPIGEFWGILLVSLQKQSSEGVGLISFLKKVVGSLSSVGQLKHGLIQPLWIRKPTVRGPAAIPQRVGDQQGWHLVAQGAPPEFREHAPITAVKFGDQKPLPVVAGQGHHLLCLNCVEGKQ